MQLQTAQAQQVRSGLTEQPETLGSVLKHVQFFKASEYRLIQLMVESNIWVGAVPSDPGGAGELEFGLVPYWVNNPPQFIAGFLQRVELAKVLWHLLDVLLPAQIDAANYASLRAALKANKLVANDGTIYGEAQYEEIDEGWVWAAINGVLSRHYKDQAPFSNLNVTPISITGSAPDHVTIALVSDWGTGAYPGGTAVDVMNQIVGLKPDYLIHLGDVYYAGTGGDFFPLHEVQSNFLDVWPAADTQAPGTSFALAGNHEMYSGAKGYFDVALADSRFAAQQSTSYFALQYAGWTLLGLDTAYFSPSEMFMVGTIGGSGGAQAQWIQGLGLSPEQTIILSHHNGLSYDGSTETGLWSEINSALGGDPAAWYWGHNHNGIVYKTPTVTNRTTLARCLGHGALPFGHSWGLKNSPHVAFHADTVNPNADGVRLYNGFVLLTIGVNSTVTEEYYQQNTAQPVFTNSYGPGSANS